MYFHLFIQHLEAVIRAKIPSIIAMINKTIDEIEAQLDRLGRPIGGDAGVRITVFFNDLCYAVMRIIHMHCRGLCYKLHYLFAGMILLCIIYFYKSCLCCMSHIIPIICRLSCTQSWICVAHLTVSLKST